MPLEYTIALSTIAIMFLLSMSYAIGRIKGKKDCLNHVCNKCEHWNKDEGKDYGLCQNPESINNFDCKLRTSKEYGCRFFRNKRNEYKY